MLKKLISVGSIVGIIASILTLGVLPALAAGPSGTYSSGIACVNLSLSVAQFTITFYNDTGATVTTVIGSIPAGGSVGYFTGSIAGLPNGFVGSAVVSSDQPVGCSVNTQAASGTTRVGTSNGVESADTGTKLSAPQVLNNLGGFTSYVAVQNASTSVTSANFRVFNSSGAQVYSTTLSIPANSSRIFYQDDGNLPAGFIGSATVESVGGSAPLAGVVNFFNTGATASTAQFLSYNAFTSGANKVFGPRVAKNLSGVGYTSGISCQNVGSSATSVTANFTVLNQVTGGTVTASLTSPSLGPSQSWAIYLGNPTGTALDGIARYFGSVIATASSGGQVVCIFNEDNRTTFAGQGSTYNGVPDGQQTASMFFPQIVNLGSSSFQGGFQIQNTTATATTCTYTYSNGTVVPSQPLAANGSNPVFAAAHVSSPFNGSVSVTCGQQIVGIYNLSIFGGSGDPFATNNGINQ